MEQPMTSTHENIATRVATLQAGMAGQLPADVAAAFVAEAADLRAAGVPAGVPTTGSAFPDTELIDATGQPTSVATVAAGRPAVVVFYRGAWCPYCNVALRTYQEHLAPELDHLGIALVAISPQTPDGSLTMQEKHELGFPVLSDPGNRIAAALGILTGPSDDVRAAQSALGLDLTVVNADGTTGLPMPTVVVLDAEGILRWIDVHPDYTTRTEPSDVLAAVDRELV
jgi:peroxiredoxin